MAALRGEADLRIGEQTLKLVYDLPAMIEAEEISGLDFDDLLDRFRRGRNITALRNMLWAGLRRHHSDVHPLQAAELLGEAGFAPAYDAMTTALAGALPAPKKGDKANPPKAAGEGETGSAG